MDAFAGDACGTFLSGGTDSSTISGILAEVTDAPPRTYSIGFDAAGYDEMAYARIAARQFSIPITMNITLRRRCRRGDPDCDRRLWPTVRKRFGDSHVLLAPRSRGRTAWRGCLAAMAATNSSAATRYAKQYQFALVDCLPQALRAHGIEPLLLGLPGIERCPCSARRVAMSRRRTLPMPERYESHNPSSDWGSRHVLDEDSWRAST